METVTIARYINDDGETKYEARYSGGMGVVEIVRQREQTWMEDTFELVMGYYRFKQESDTE